MAFASPITRLSLRDWHLPDWSDTPVAVALRTWRSALHACLPAAVQHWLLQRQRPRLIVALAGTEARLLQELGGQRTELTRVHAQFHAALSELVPSPRAGWKETIVELPAAWVLMRPVTLPAQVKDNLRQVLAYEADRLTPFAPGDLYLDAQPADGPPRAGRLVTRLALCRRDQVDPWLALLRQMGAPPASLTWPGAWKGANLLPPEQRRRRRNYGLLLNVCLATVVVGLVAAVMISPLRQKEQQLDELNSALRKLRIEGEQVPALRAELALARTRSVAVLERKTRQPLVIDLMRELTERLPDDTWVQTINVNGTDVDVRGESARATDLLSLLEQAPGISRVSFRSPVMQVSQTGMERFHIAFQYQRPPA